MGDHVVPWTERFILEIPEDQISCSPLTQRSHVIKPESTSSVGSRHRKEAGVADTRGVHGRTFHEQTQHPQFLQHVDVVIAGRSVRSDAKVHAAAQQEPVVGDTGPELEVALDVQGNACPRITQDFRVTSGHVDTVGSEEPRWVVKVSLVSIVGDGRRPIRCSELLDLLACLLKVKLHDDAKIAGTFEVLPNELRARRIGSMRTETGPDAAVGLVVPAHDKLFSLLHLAPLVVEGSGTRREIGSYACLVHSPSHIVFEEVHLGERCRPGHDAFGQRKQATIVDVVTIHESFAWKHVVMQPHIKRHFIGKPSQERHGKVPVGVDKPRSHQVPRRVDDAGTPGRIHVVSDAADLRAVHKDVYDTRRVITSPSSIKYSG